MSIGEPEPLCDLSVKEHEPPVDLSLLPTIGIDNDADQVPLASRTFYAIMLGTVASAVNDFVRYRYEKRPKSKELARNASAWLFCETDPTTDPVLSTFQWVCMVLDKDADIIRQRIRRMTISDLPKIDRRSQ